VVFEAGFFGNLAQQVPFHPQHQGRIGLFHFPTGTHSVWNNVDVPVDRKAGVVLYAVTALHSHRPSYVDCDTRSVQFRDLKYAGAIGSQKDAQCFAAVP